jgi:uncharacterized protein YjbI with pentapeptide repeats
MHVGDSIDEIPGGVLDARGVSFDPGRLRAVLDKLPRGEDGHPRAKELHFDEAHFQERADFGAIEVSGPVVFKGARFDYGGRFGDARFEHAADFRDARVTGELRLADSVLAGLDLRGAEVGVLDLNQAKVNTLRMDQATIMQYAEFESSELGDAHFTRARFADEGANFSEATFERSVFFAAGFDVAVFTKAGFRGHALFLGARFHKSAWFDRCVFTTSGSFGGAEFDGHATFHEAIVGDSLSFSGAKFANARDLGTVAANGSVELDEAVFAERVRITAMTDVLTCKETQFRGGVEIITPGAVDLSEASFDAPSVVTGRTGIGPEDLMPDAPTPRLRSLARANVDNLVISDFDLAECRFAGAHNLDRLRMEGAVQFATPPDAGIWTRRRTVFEEHEWRKRHRFPPGWLEPATGASAPVIEAEDIAAIYRALRKGREDSKDAPGAADFYYGEMEMRRHAWRQPRSGEPPSAKSEGRLVWLYWLVSGYGLRPSRSFISLAIVVVLLAAGLDLWGFNPDLNFGRSLLYSLGSAVAFGAAPEYETLTASGDAIHIALRILGPLLLGLGLLAVRGRVQR